MDGRDYLSADLESLGLLVKLVGLDTELRRLLLGTHTLIAFVGAKEVVPPAEASSIASKEGHVVVVVVIRTRPERHPVVQTDGEVVARVRIHGLEETEQNPNVHGDDVQVLGVGAKHERTANGTEAENQNLKWVRILSGQTERRRVLVVHLVNVLVQRTPVHQTVDPVVEGVLKHEKERNLPGHLVPAGERNLMSRQAKVFANGVEAPDLRKFHGEVTQKHETGALPLVLQAGHVVGLQLVLAHRRHRINNDPGD